MDAGGKGELLTKRSSSFCGRYARPTLWIPLSVVLGLLDGCVRCPPSIGRDFAQVQ
jgi:hypothetical protein